MEAASRSALEPLKDELEPLPDSDGPAPVKAVNASPAEIALSNTQELVSMESLMGWSDLASRAIVETPPATDSLIPAEALREEARKLEELLDSLSNSPFAQSDTASTSEDAAPKATSDSQLVRSLEALTDSLAAETAALTAIDSPLSLTSNDQTKAAASVSDLTAAQPPEVVLAPVPIAAPTSVPTATTEKEALPDFAALDLLEPPDVPLAPLPLELEKLPVESAPLEASLPAKATSELQIAEPLALVGDTPAIVAPLPSVRTKPTAIPTPTKRLATKSTSAAKPAKPVVKMVPPSAPVKASHAASAISGTAPSSGPPAAKITPYPNATPATAGVPNVMDRDFIARNQIVERYLSGKLPVKGATDFERFCHDNPNLLDEIGLPQHVHAGLRLLEASGKPEPWQEQKKSIWAKPQLMFGFAGATVVLAAVVVMLGNQVSDKSAYIAKLKQDLVAQPLEPAATTRVIRILPNRNGSTNTPAVTIGGGSAQLCELRIDLSRSAFRSFRVTIDRIDQGRVAVLQNIYKDSNGHVRIALNSSALGPGNYSFSIDGITWRGETVPDSWVTIGIQR